MNLINLKKECEEAKNIVITGHIRPDGDCVGSCMATYLYLNKVLDNANIKVCIEQPADIFSCIKDFDKIDTAFVAPEYKMYEELNNSDTEVFGKSAYYLSELKGNKIIMADEKLLDEALSKNMAD